MDPAADVTSAWRAVRSFPAGVPRANRGVCSRRIVAISCRSSRALCAASSRAWRSLERWITGLSASASTTSATPRATTATFPAFGSFRQNQPGSSKKPGSGS